MPLKTAKQHTLVTRLNPFDNHNETGCISIVASLAMLTFYDNRLRFLHTHALLGSTDSHLEGPPMDKSIMAHGESRHAILPQGRPAAAAG